MPFYDFVCDKCGLVILDDFISVLEAQDKTCACGGKLVKQFGQVNIAFKGPGFYVNDYKAKGEK